jgi:hypothetical protein
VVMDGNEFTDYETPANQETGETNLVIIHPDGDHDIVITRTNIVPEFLYSISIRLAALGGVKLFWPECLFSKGSLPN